MDTNNSIHTSELVLNKNFQFLAGRIHTDLKGLEDIMNKCQELMASQEKAKQSITARAGIISHQSRDTFAGIKSYTDLIEEHAQQGEELLESLSVISETAENGMTVNKMLLHDLRNNSIDQSNFTNCSIAECIRQAFNSYSFKKGMQDRVQLEIEEDFQFYGDKALMQHVLINLLKNALYYFDTYIAATIKLKLIATETDNKLLFTDTAVGIAEDKIPSLFADFVTSGKVGGTGLGLSFCKRVIEFFGGEISCESVLGKYTTFIISFPK